MHGQDRCLVFQNDNSILLVTEASHFEEARDRLRFFAELKQAAGPYHVYRVTDLSLWAAAASGATAKGVIGFLTDFGQHAPPVSLLAHIQKTMAHFGVVRLSGDPKTLRLSLLTGRCSSNLRETLGWNLTGMRQSLRPSSEAG